jgi:acyl-CoA thioester hydrolase
MSDPSPSQRHASITIHRKVEWADTDASGHWHNTAVIRLCEMAESALLATLDLDDLFYSHGVPRVRMVAEFKGSARFGDVVDIHCMVTEVGRSRIVFAHEVKDSAGHVLAVLEVVAVLVAANGTPRSFPEDVRTKLLEAGSQGVGD